MQRHLRTIGLALALLAPALPRARAQGADEVALEIHWRDQTDTVTRDEFAQWFMRLFGEFHAREFARGIALEHRGRAAGITVDAVDVAATLEEEIRERIGQTFGNDKGEWLAELAATGRSEEGYRAQREIEIANELYAKRLLIAERRVTDERVQAAFEKLYGIGGRRIEVDLIRLDVVVPSLDENRSQADQAAAREIAQRESEARAQAIHRRLLKGEDFAAVARRESDDASTRERGGRYEGWFAPTAWPQEAREALAKLPEGGISSPHRAGGAYYIVRVRKAVQTALEDVRAEVERAALAIEPTASEVLALINQVDDGASFEVLPAMWDEGVQPSDELVLRVGDRGVARGEYGRFLRALRGEALVRTFVEHWMVATLARRAGLDVGEEELVEHIRADIAQRVRDIYHGEPDRWITALGAQNRTEESFWREQRVRARIDLLAQKLMLMERKVTQDELLAAWEAIYGKGGRRIDLRMILLHVPAPTVETQVSREEWARLAQAKTEETKAKARALIERIRKGEDFGAVALRHSEDPVTRENGGAFPGGFRWERFNDNVTRAIQDLEVGRISDPVEHNNDVHVFLITGEERMPFEQARPELERRLAERPPTISERTGWINLLMNEVRFVVRPPLHR